MPLLDCGAMNARVDHILDEVLSLEPDDRSFLVVALLDSLDGDDEVAVARAWASEVLERRKQLRSGEAAPVPWADAKARLNAL